jgi:ketosteroid isomerase-like protein
VRQELLRLEKAWAAAHASGDTAGLGRAMVEEYAGVTATGDFWPKAEEIAQTRAGTASDPAAADATVPLDAVRVHLYGDVALMTSRITEPGARGSAPRHYYYTSAYVWRDGRWQAAMGHVSRAAVDAPAALLGTYAVELPPSGAGGTPAERWGLTLAPGGRFAVTRAGRAAVDGRYRVAADAIVFSEETGPDACPDAETGPGTYRWRLAAGSLTLTSVVDRCDGRRAAFTARPLTRAAAGTP